MNELRVSLAKIIAALTEMNRPVVRHLNEGLSRDEIIELANSSALELPHEVVELYEWRNGTSLISGEKLGGLYLFPRYYFMSLDEALSSYQALKDSGQWDLSLFPLFADGGGDFLAVVLPLHEGESSSIVECPVDEHDHSIIYDSLTAMAASIAEGFSVGAIYEKDGFLRLDRMRYAEVAEKYNRER